MEQPTQVEPSLVSILYTPEDKDDGGDGVLDEDNDDDNDGLKNDKDPDDDGDGIPDENDEL